jgi:hypothetical protein
MHSNPASWAARPPGCKLRKLSQITDSSLDIHVNWRPDVKRIDCHLTNPDDPSPADSRMSISFPFPSPIMCHQSTSSRPPASAFVTSICDFSQHRDCMQTPGKKRKDEVQSTRHQYGFVLLTENTENVHVGQWIMSWSMRHTDVCFLTTINNKLRTIYAPYFVRVSRRFVQQHSRWRCGAHWQSYGGMDTLAIGVVVWLMNQQSGKR